MLAPGILEPIKGFEDIYTDDIVNAIYEQKLPVQICEKKLFLAIVHHSTRSYLRILLLSSSRLQTVKTIVTTETNKHKTPHFCTASYESGVLL